VTTDPTDHQIRELFRSLHKLNRADTANGPTRLDQLEQRVLTACKRNRAGDAHRRDGYPSGGGPGDGGEDAPQSSTEAAALTNLANTGRDPVGELVEATVGHLLEAVNHLGALQSNLALLDHLSRTDRNSNPPADCRGCTRTVMCTAEDPIRGGYCSACSSAWYRWRDDELTAGRDPDRARFEHWRRQKLAAA
jgi:hypothetical protein